MRVGLIRLPAIFLILALALPAHSSPFSPRKCFSHLLEFARTRLLPNGRRWDIPRNIAFGVIKANVYPFVAASRIAYWGVQKTERSQGWGRLWASLRQDKFAVVLYLGLLGATNLSSITYSQMDAYVDTLDDLPKSAVVVLVNGFSEADPLYQYTEYRAMKLQQRFPHTELIRARGAFELQEKLAALSATVGPLDVLEIHGHGNSGAVRVSSDAEVAQTGDPRESAHLAPPLDGGLPLTGVMKPNAKIVLYSCSAGRGADGEALVEMVGNAYLDQGGTVYASRVSIFANQVEQVALFYGLTPPFFSDFVHNVGEVGMPALPLYFEIKNGELLDRYRDPEPWFLYRLVEQRFPPRDAAQ